MLRLYIIVKDSSIVQATNLEAILMLGMIVDILKVGSWEG